jgi:iron-sulfur cluster assembly protein
MIVLTDKAAEKVKEILQVENKEGLALRVGIKGGGCSGFSYTLNFDKPNGEIDQVFEDKGVKIIVDSKSFVYLSGTKLDFVDSLNGSGFTFENPNATKSCGCGSSFQA